MEVWTCVNFSTHLNRDVPFQFCYGLVHTCNSKGMVMVIFSISQFMLSIQVNSLSEPNFFFWAICVYCARYLTCSLTFP